jgi:beta-galactosidase GanA
LYKEYEFQPLHWGGIVDLEGKKTDRADVVRRVSDMVEEYADFVARACTHKGQVALLVSKENQIVCNGVGQEQFLRDELRGVYCVFREIGYQTDFITPEHLENGYAMDYDMIYAPFLAVVQQPITFCLSEYVIHGGTLIAGARFGYMEEHGWYAKHMPPEPLQAIFGIQVKNAYKQTHVVVDYYQRRYLGYHHTEEIFITTADVAATFEDGGAAVTVNRFSKGKAIYIGTHPGHAHLDERKSLLAALIRNEAPRLPRILTDTSEGGLEVDVHSISDEHSEMLIVINYPTPAIRTDGGCIKKLRVSHEDLSICAIQQLWPNRDIPLFHDERVAFEVEIEMNKVSVLILHK